MKKLWSLFEDMTSAVIFLGASSFASEQLDDSQAFSNSHKSLLNYFIDPNGFGIPDSHVLDLFDSAGTQTDILAKITSFLKKIQKSEPKVEKLFFSYIGHGFFNQSNAGYFWALKDTENENPFSTGIDVHTFGYTIKENTAGLSCIGIVDSCFAGATNEAFMTMDGPSTVAFNEILNSLPSSGGRALICSSSKNRISYLTDDRSATVFSKSLMDILHGWESQGRRILSLNEIADLSRFWQKQFDPSKANAPVVSNPSQDFGNLSADPIFPILKMEIVESNEHEKSDRWNELNADETLEIWKRCNLAPNLQSDIMRAIEATQLSRLSYAYTSRVKKPEDVREKILRKREDPSNSDYSVYKLTDILGVKFITLFREDIHEVVDTLFSILGGGHDLSPNPLSESIIKEVIIYSAGEGPSSRTFSERLKKMATDSLNSEFHFDTKFRQDYSSIHVVCEVAVSSGSSTTVAVPIEFQIRSVFEDAWAQIDHMLRYRFTREKNSQSRKNIPSGAEAHLRLMKRLLDTVSEYADIVKEESQAQKRSPGQAITAIDGLEEFSQIANTYNIDPRIVNEFRVMLERKGELDKRLEASEGLPWIERNGSDSLQLREDYAILAEEVFGLYEQEQRAGGYLSDPELSNPGEICFYYFLRMEEAFCRLMCDDLNEIRTAVGIYEEIVQTLPNYPVPYFRLGQALGRLSDNIKACANYELAWELTKTISDSTEQRSAAQLTPVQEKYVRDKIHRLLGFRYWRSWLGEQNGAANDLTFLLKAIDFTFEGVKGKKGPEKTKLLNNVLAYSNDLSHFCEKNKLECDHKSLTKKWLVKAVDELSKLIDVETSKDVNSLDSLAVGYQRIGKTEKSLQIATSVLDLLSGDPIDFDSDLQRESVETMRSNCWNIVRSNGEFWKK